MKGQIISGDFSSIVVRQKSGGKIELGELLVCESGGRLFLMQAYDLLYGSQMSQTNLELMSGLKLEGENDLEFFDPELRNYRLAVLKSLLVVESGIPRSSKELPPFFSFVREIAPGDTGFLGRPESPLFLGRLRSGSKVLDVPVCLPADKALCEHLLVAATTGRGKSNFASCMLWELIDKEYAGALVLDPHDEYYGRNGVGLKDHPSKNLVYYSPDPVPGQPRLKICTESLRPGHFRGALALTEAQEELFMQAHRKHGKSWVKALLLEKENAGFQEITTSTARRKLMSVLGISVKGSQTECSGIFDMHSGKGTVSDICGHLEAGKVVIIDTSSLGSRAEILAGSAVASSILSRYRKHKAEGRGMPVVTIVLEEAPRVLGKDVLLRGTNIFETIAREGRKFRVGLTAITQLPSLMPRQILANMNTKVIFGIEMAPERQAVIESASQDLSSDSRSIASLDKGEAIITSNFTRFAVPVRMPYFPDLAKETQNRMNREKYKKEYPGIVMDGPAKTSGGQPADF